MAVPKTVRAHVRERESLHCCEHERKVRGSEGQQQPIIICRSDVRCDPSSQQQSSFALHRHDTPSVLQSHPGDVGGQEHYATKGAWAAGAAGFGAGGSGTLNLFGSTESCCGCEEACGPRRVLRLQLRGGVGRTRKKAGSKASGRKRNGEFSSQEEDENSPGHTQSGEVDEPKDEDEDIGSGVAPLTEKDFVDDDEEEEEDGQGRDGEEDNDDDAFGGLGIAG
jgi:hypothetical protein